MLKTHMLGRVSKSDRLLSIVSKLDQTDHESKKKQHEASSCLAADYKESDVQLV